MFECLVSVDYFKTIRVENLKTQTPSKAKRACFVDICSLVWNRTEKKGRRRNPKNETKKQQAKRITMMKAGWILPTKKNSTAVDRLTLVTRYCVTEVLASTTFITVTPTYQKSGIGDLFYAQNNLSVSNILLSWSSFMKYIWFQSCVSRSYIIQLL